METAKIFDRQILSTHIIYVISNFLLIFRYYHGPTPIKLQYATSQDIINSFQSIRQEMEAYTPRLTQVGDLYSLKNKFPITLWAHSLFIKLILYLG